MENTSLGFLKPTENEYYDIGTVNHNTQLANDLIEENSSAIGQNTHDISQLSNPNLIINETFQIWQRGTTFTNVSGVYTADRWLYDTHGKASGYNGKISKLANGLRLTQLDSLSMNHRLRYLMEVNEKLKGKKLTLTLEYITNKVFGVSFLGNNTTTAADSNINKIKLTGVYNGDLELFSMATYNNTDTSMFLEIYSVKVELGEIATPLAPRSYGEELALCQRYYNIFYLRPVYYSVGAGSGYQTEYNFSIPCMRVTPTVTHKIIDGSKLNVYNSAVVSRNEKTVDYTIFSNTVGLCYAQLEIKLDAEIY